MICTLRADASLAYLPIIILTARAKETDKIIGLELGADDYVSKPFNPYEIVARVRTILRRVRAGVGAKAPNVLEFGDIRIDVVKHRVIVNGKPITLTPTEFDLLYIFMENPGRVLTRSALITHSRGFDSESLERTIDTHIKNLRKKIAPDPKQTQYIQTVYGVGYRMEMA